MEKFVLYTVMFASLIYIVHGAFGGHDKYNDRMLLSEVQTLTLYHGRMTNGRRSSPVPQLKCVGGTAGCNDFIPKVVQCYNRGGDGYDVQWECKSDMDNDYRFGQVEVICEGFDHSADPFILRGSCGLEYTLDLTKEGYNNRNQKQHDYYGGRHYDENYHDRSGYHQSGHYSKRASSIFGDLILLCIVGVIIYAIYKTCIADRSHDNSYGPSDRGYRPPPPGFRSDYMPPHDGDSCSSTYTGNTYRTHQNNQPTGGGFWSGAFTGGILGYLMGNRNNYYDGSYTYPTYQRPYTTYHHRPSTGWGWGNWFSGGGSTYTTRGSGSGGMGFSGSSGTRTASGFGGTRRR